MIGVEQSRPPLRFQLHPQGIGDTVDIVEIAGDLHRMEDLFIGYPFFPESLDLGSSHRSGIPGNPLGVLQERQCLRVEDRLPIVLSKLLDQRVVLRLLTESLSVVDDSVVAPIDG